MIAVLGMTGLGFGCAPGPWLSRRRALPPVTMSVGDLLIDAADGDISAALEAAALAFAGFASVGLAWTLVERDEDEEVDVPLECGELQKVTVDVDLGANGEPKGEQRLFFKPLLPRSEFVLLDLRVPLGLLIEEVGSGGSTPAGPAGGDAGTIQVTGALPGFSAFKKVEEGDLLRAVTAYAAVAGDAPMWQQVTSGTPVGDVASKRLIFKTDGASCGVAPNLNHGTMHCTRLKAPPPRLPPPLPPRLPPPLPPPIPPPIPPPRSCHFPSASTQVRQHPRRHRLPPC